MRRFLFEATASFMVQGTIQIALAVVGVDPLWRVVISLPPGLVAIWWAGIRWDRVEVPR